MNPKNPLKHVMHGPFFECPRCKCYTDNVEDGSYTEMCGICTKGEMPPRKTFAYDNALAYDVTKNDDMNEEEFLEKLC